MHKENRKQTHKIPQTKYRKKNNQNRTSIPNCCKSKENYPQQPLKASKLNPTNAIKATIPKLINKQLSNNTIKTHKTKPVSNNPSTTQSKHSQTGTQSPNRIESKQNQNQSKQKESEKQKPQHKPKQTPSQHHLKESKYHKSHQPVHRNHKVKRNLNNKTPL